MDPAGARRAAAAVAMALLRLRRQAFVDELSQVVYVVEGFCVSPLPYVQEAVRQDQHRQQLDVVSVGDYRIRGSAGADRIGIAGDGEVVAGGIRQSGAVAVVRRNADRDRVRAPAAELAADLFQGRK